jgi:hypothetical protein
MLRRHVLATTVISLSLAMVALPGVAHATDPGTPADPAADAGKTTVREIALEGSFIEGAKTYDLNNVGQLPGGVCDGYVALTESDGVTLSDVVVFHDNATLPSGVCGPTVHFVTIFSDGSHPERPFNFGDGVPDSTPANLLPLFVPGGTLPLAAGPNATQFLSEPNIPPEVVHYTASGSLSDGGAAGSETYTIISDVPAMPTWGLALLGTLLAGITVVMTRRRNAPAV